MIDRWWIPLAVIVAGVGGCSHSGGADEAKHAEGEAEAHVSVKVEAARLGTVSETIDGLGRCESLPDHLATLTPAVGGHVHKLLVSQGATVQKDQPIVELDTGVARADLAEKTATRDGLKASLTLLKSLPRAEERKPMELAIDQGKVGVERAQALVDQLTPLLARKEVSPQQVFDARNALNTAKLLQQTAEAHYRVFIMGPRPEAIAEAESKIKTADGLVAFSQAHLDYHTIRSPIDGVLDSLTCHPGQSLNVGATIGEVVDTRKVLAAVWLPPGAARAVRVGHSARVRSADDLAKPEEKEDKSAEAEAILTGKVAFVGRVADAQTGNLPIRILVDNPTGRLALGQMVEVSIGLEERQNVLQVPIAAVLDLGEGSLIEVVREGKSVEIHPEVGKPNEGWVAVTGTDLKPGENVIVDGGYHLPEGTAVKVEHEKVVAKAEVAK